MSNDLNTELRKIGKMIRGLPYLMDTPQAREAEFKRRLDQACIETFGEVLSPNPLMPRLSITEWLEEINAQGETCEN